MKRERLVEILQFWNDSEHLNETADLILDEIEKDKYSPRDPVRVVLEVLVKSLDDLIADSEGVAGLHRNGDVATWDELTSGGRFEDWLSSLDAARAALSVSTPTGEGEAPCPQPHRYDRGECCGGDCAAHSQQGGEREAVARTLVDDFEEAVRQEVREARLMCGVGPVPAVDQRKLCRAGLDEHLTALRTENETLRAERDAAIARAEELEAIISNNLKSKDCQCA